ncbi:phage tail protein [Holdemanella porci]|uniref:phage tail protein n=1 Tax=Holdemanella porci TaxID=2652276 RepID=UPI003AB2E804
MATKSANAKIYQYNTIAAVGATKVIPNKMLAGEQDKTYLLIGNGSTQWQSLPKLCGQTLTGTLIEWNGTTIPAGYLNADGSAVSRTTYAALYAICGTRYGAGNGSTTFNLPNLVNRTIHGIGNSTGSIADGTFDQAHTHNSGDIHGVGGAWGPYDDSYGYYEYYSGTPGWCAYPLEMSYFMDDPKSVGETTHGTGVWGTSTAGGNPPPFMYRKVLIKY